MSKEFIGKHTDHVEFRLERGQTLAINLDSDVGIDRVMVRFDKDRQVGVIATGHADFEFETKRKGAPDNLVDFVLRNPDLKGSLIEYIQQKFWSQFGWGDIISLHENKKAVRAINRKIKKLVDDFEGKAAEELNGMSVLKAVREKRKKK